MRNSITKWIPALILITILCCSSFIKAKSDPLRKSSLLEIITLQIINKSGLALKDAVITIPIQKIKSKYPHFNEKIFIATENGTELPSQTEDINGDKVPDNVVICVDLSPKQIKTVQLHHDGVAVLKKEFKKRTQAELAVKTGYEYKDGYYTSGKFEKVEEAVVPKTHFAHDALYKYEGPGWESDKVMYRFYLDSRNRNDIWGKKVDDVVLQRVGNEDLVSNSNESYSRMCDWGMDIFKVGESLGIGSIGMWADDKVNPVEKTDKIVCKIPTDGIIKSDVFTNYYGWQIGTQKYDVSSLISIEAGSRLSKEELQITGDPPNICTGIAKHEGCALITDNGKKEWGYIASYGLQSLAGDSLGLVIFYNKADLIKVTEDAASYIIILKPHSGKIGYYFGSAWQQELKGIKNKNEFIQYLGTTASELSNPVIYKLQ